MYYRVDQVESKVLVLTQQLSPGTRHKAQGTRRPEALKNPKWDDAHHQPGLLTGIVPDDLERTADKTG